MLKLWGACIVFFGFLALGHFEGGRRRRALARLRDLMQALLIMERELSLKRPPLPALFETAGGHCRFSENAEAMKACAEECEKGNDFTETWSEYITSICADHPIAELLNTAASVMGRYETLGQEQALCHLRQQLEQALAPLAKRTADESKLCLVLGCTAGGLLSILLL